MLVDLVSRGGNLLLDIGPTGDGRIPVIMQERLIQIGTWLRQNGEAIYGTRPWTRTRQWSGGEQPKLETGEYMTRYEVTDYIERRKPGQAVIEAFFTRKGRDLYAIVPGIPRKEVRLENLVPPPGTRATLLGPNTDLKWTAAGGGVTLSLPNAAGTALAAQPAFVVKLAGALPAD